MPALTIESAFLVWLLRNHRTHRVLLTEIKWFKEQPLNSAPYLNPDKHLYRPLFLYLWDAHGYSAAAWATKLYICQFSLVSQQQALEYLLNAA